MLPSGFKSLIQKAKYLPKLFYSKVEPCLMNGINVVVVQPTKSIIRFHHLKKTYNSNYRHFVAFSKTFAFVYVLLNFIEYDLGLNSLIGKLVEKTEYATLVQKASHDSAGVDKIQFAVKEMIEKGKKNGLLSIELNQLAYLLEPYEIAWQGRYLASLKS